VLAVLTSAGPVAAPEPLTELTAEDTLLDAADAAEPAADVALLAADVTLLAATDAAELTAAPAELSAAPAELDVVEEVPPQAVASNPAANKAPASRPRDQERRCGSNMISPLLLPQATDSGYTICPLSGVTTPSVLMVRPGRNRRSVGARRPIAQIA
jgi:hypothetical protein